MVFDDIATAGQTIVSGGGTSLQPVLDLVGKPDVVIREAPDGRIEVVMADDMPEYDGQTRHTRP